MLQELVDMLEKAYSNKLKAVILYGSVARGEATSESDIDIMLLVDGNNQEYIRWVKILPFYRNVSEEGVVLYTTCCAL